MLRRPIRLVAVVVAAAACAGTAFAGDNDPRSVRTGNIYIKTNTEFAKCKVDGQEASVVYDSTGHTVIIERVDRTRSHSVHILPTDGRHRPAKVSVRSKDFRMKKTRKKENGQRVIVVEWRADKSVKLPKAGKGSPKARPEKPEKPDKPARPEDPDDDED